MGRPSNLRLAASLFSALDLSISLVARTIGRTSVYLLRYKRLTTIRLIG